MLFCVLFLYKNIQIKSGEKRKSKAPGRFMTSVDRVFTADESLMGYMNLYVQ